MPIPTDRFKPGTKVKITDFSYSVAFCSIKSLGHGWLFKTFGNNEVPATVVDYDPNGVYGENLPIAVVPDAFTDVLVMTSIRCIKVATCPTCGK